MEYSVIDYTIPKNMEKVQNTRKVVTSFGTIKIVKSLILVLSMASISVAQVPGGGGPGGPGGPGGGGTPGNWQVTYALTGTCQFNGWTVINLPGGGQAAVPVQHDCFQAQNIQLPLASSSISFTRGGTSYYPPGATQPVFLNGSLVLSVKVKTKYQWIGAGTPPTTLKLKLTGTASGGYMANPIPVGQGSVSSANGLGHTSAVSHSVSYMGWSGSANTTGSRYREFKVGSNGTVEIQSSLDASSTAVGMVGVSAEFTAPETNWAATIVSDRDETFRRVQSGSTVKRVSNYFEDDEITSRGGDGTRYGDTKMTTPNFWNGNDWDFAGQFFARLEGAWSISTTGNFTANPLISGGGNFTMYNFWVGVNTLTSGFDSATCPGTKDLTATLIASDPVNSISDSCVYKMKVHLPAEKTVNLGSFTGYLHKANTGPGCSDYDVSRHAASQVTNVIANSTSNPVSHTYSTSLSTQLGLNYEYTAEAGASLDAKIAEVHFGNSTKASGSIQVTFGVTNASTVTIPPGKKVAFWQVDNGTLKKEGTARYADNGYSGDAKEYVVTNYSRELVLKEYPIGSAVTEP